MMQLLMVKDDESHVGIVIICNNQIIMLTSSYSLTPCQILISYY